MSAAEEARTTIRNYFDAVDANDFDRVISLFDSDIVYDRPGYDPIRGVERLRQFFTNDRVIASGKHEIEGILVDGDQVAAWGRFSGQSRSGAELNESFCDIYEMKGTRICGRRTYFFRPGV